MRRAVPRLVDLRIGQAVIGGEVEDRHALGDEPGRLRERRRVRHREEDGVALGEHRIVMRGEREVAHAGERRVDGVEALARVGIRGDRHQFEIGMRGKQAHELDPRVAGCSHHRCLEGHHDHFPLHDICAFM